MRQQYFKIMLLKYFDSTLFRYVKWENMKVNRTDAYVYHK